MKVLNFGSLNLDYVYSVDNFLRPGETKSAMDRNTFLGGKGFNQSIALAKAGIPVYHAGNAGESAEVYPPGTGTVWRGCPLPEGRR